MDGITLAPAARPAEPEHCAALDPALDRRAQEGAADAAAPRRAGGCADKELGGADKTHRLARGRDEEDAGRHRGPHGVTPSARSSPGPASGPRPARSSPCSPTQYPGHPLAIDAFRWLLRYHASTRDAPPRRDSAEARLRQRRVRAAKPATAGRSSRPAAPATRPPASVVTEDVYRVYRPEHDREVAPGVPRLASRSSRRSARSYARDPAAWLCFLAARRQVGKHAEAEAFVRDYFKHTPGAAAMAAGRRPVARLPRRRTVAGRPRRDRRFSRSRSASAGSPRRRPFLDGKLDDACWADLQADGAEGRAPRGDKPDEVKAFADEYKTEARFAYDDSSCTSR